VATILAETVSNSAADRAGDVFRGWARLPAETRMTGEPRERMFDAIGTMQTYRTMHAHPLTKVTRGVRTMVRAATGDDSLRPGQRFKRMDRIFWKLLRQPHMRLSQMEDIGGCRLVLPGLDEVYAVADRVLRTWGDSARMTDYIAAPKRDGYRAVHIVERRDGRQIEVQVRTFGQHVWATAMEDYSPVTGFNLRDGDGPDDLRAYLRMAADRIARVERGERPDEALELEFARVRERVRPYFEDGA
jgi:ppGpp synthetase/RelA/SpoT-type nucleotidyltranferase